MAWRFEVLLVDANGNDSPWQPVERIPVRHIMNRLDQRKPPALFTSGTSSA